ncbi:NAD(P)-dependent alcohol dehydrogenase [Gramella sp. GC03-9]|uniref:NAD(P)-dependent alcohol dehydrogenase n=1 Tax=Christiangramia oceanisediminis TaxID=2920386 RepID=A0A9X2I384_9FLAO|nr:NAD(P)-dependent alcohol dehydrogenase [Gramella oceanisediminis]MCP9199030.1 NAD(P)-dependent alcohol dehydrogenase [Gramella oceanisediminis]
MKAAVRSQYGLPEVLTIEEIERPVAGDNEILVKVFATTVNRTDCANLTGKPYVVRIFTGITAPVKRIPGTDFAGEIVEVGKNVSDFRSGDRVFGFDDNGLSSMAEFTSIPVKKAITKIPEGISFEEAVASAEGAHYAINFINKVKLRAGEKALVNGGTGAIGSALIQLLKFFGLKVVATGPTGQLDKLKDLGVERLIDYKIDDFVQDNEKFDYVFDAVGKSDFGKCKRLLVDDGIYISSELGPYSQNPFLAITTTFSEGKKVRFPLPQNTTASLKLICGLLKSGDFRPLIDRSFDLQDVKEAFSYVMTGQKIGNVILRVKD